MATSLPERVLSGVRNVPLRAHDERGRHAVERSDRAWVLVWLGVALGLVAVLVTILVAEGEAAGHGVFHFLFGAAALVVLAAIVRATGRPPRWRPPARTFVLWLLFVSSSAAFLESIGAAGYDRSNASQRIEWLTTLHSASAPLGGLVILAFPIGLVVLTRAVVRRARVHRRADSTEVSDARC